jgi:membrane-associated protease RseP (regulator of RpoE activity)
MDHRDDLRALDGAPLAEEAVVPRKNSSHRIHFILFLATIFTTLLAGAILEITTGLSFYELTTALTTIMNNPVTLSLGIPFSFTLMAILLTHEMGHYLTAKYYNVPATLPYFIPAPPIPFLIGTFGAFIRMKSPILRRRAILEIGASGPIAGFIVAIIAVGVGFQLSEIVPIEQTPDIILGIPLIFAFLENLLIDIPDGHTIAFNSVVFAGWIGLFVTALNLLPIGQLDGGHVVYALVGDKHKYVSIAMIGMLVVMGFIGWPGWYIWAALTAILGVRHPPMVDPEVGLEPKQKFIGWLSLAIFVVTFTPNPFMIAV